MLSTHLPAEKELLSDPLMTTSHPERSGCRKLPGPECAPQIEFLEQATSPTSALWAVSSRVGRDR